jgi:hypothetical protein
MHLWIRVLCCAVLCSNHYRGRTEECVGPNLHRFIVGKCIRMDKGLVTVVVYCLVISRWTGERMEERAGVGLPPAQPGPTALFPRTGPAAADRGAPPLPEPGVRPGALALGPVRKSRALALKTDIWRGCELSLHLPPSLPLSLSSSLSTPPSTPLSACLPAYLSLSLSPSIHPSYFLFLSPSSSRHPPSPSLTSIPLSLSLPPSLPPSLLDLQI